MSKGQTLRRRIFRWLAIAAAVVLLTFTILAGLVWHWLADPPPLPRDLSVTQLVPEQRGDRVWLGQSWSTERDGLRVLYVTGPPFDLGYANGVLTQGLMHRQEDALIEVLDTFVPAWARWLVKGVVVYQNRDLEDYVTPEHKLEILGLSHGCPDTHPTMGPFYHRLLNYHAAQDISYMMMNHPLIRGCTAFGAWGEATVDGHLLCGRNFDWEAHPVFDRDRLVILCEPDGGIPFISVAWSGMVGAVSGLNRAGVSLTMNGAPSRLPGGARTPTCLVGRTVLQNARNLDEAVAIIRAANVFVSAHFLVGSRADGRFIVVEKTPDTTAIRDADTAHTLACANHYLTDALRDRPENTAFRDNMDSPARYARVSELLTQAAGTLDAAAAARILRDRRLPGGAFAGNGHRSSLNPIIATHAVIIDITAGLLWVPQPPHQLGKFIAFDVNDFERVLPERALKADPMQASGEYDRYVAARTALEKGRKALSRGKAEEAVKRAKEAEALNPGFYQNAWLLGEALLKQGRTDEARAALVTALRGEPAWGSERRRIKQLLAQFPAPPAE